MADDDFVLVRVEVPKGTRNKYEWDEELGVIVLDRRLFAAVTFPGDYGEIIGTLAEDNDPMDARVVLTEPTLPGCLVRARPIGVLLAADEDDDERDDKVICVPSGDPAWDTMEEIDDPPGNLGNEITHFFDVYGDLRGKELHIDGFGDRSSAVDLIRTGRERTGSSQ